MSTDSALRTTRLAYDQVAADYARLVPDLGLETPLDRAVLAAFVELASGDGTTLEGGTAGPGARGLPCRRAARARRDGLGLVAWYPLINLPTAALADVATESARVVRPGAPVLVAFQCGDGERVERSTSYGRDVLLTYYRHRISDVADALEAAGLVLHATVERRPALEFESTAQACLLAHAPRRSAG
jgi:hypothetical protein